MGHADVVDENGLGWQLQLLKMKATSSIESCDIRCEHRLHSSHRICKSDGSNLVGERWCADEDCGRLVERSIESAASWFRCISHVRDGHKVGLRENK